MALLNPSYVTAISAFVTSLGLLQNGSARFKVIVDGGPGMTDAAQSIGLAPDGYVVFGGITFYCTSRVTLCPLEVLEYLANFTGPSSTITEAATTINLSTGTAASAMSATCFRFRGITPTEVGLGSANNMPIAYPVDPVTTQPHG